MKNVISKMEEERMDADACVYADESILIDMGLVRGIIIKLKAHLLPSVLGANGNANNLAATVRATTTERTIGVKRRRGDDNRKVIVRWARWDTQKSGYITMNENNGGGQRKIDIPMSSDYQQTLNKI